MMSEARTAVSPPPSLSVGRYTRMSLYYLLYYTSVAAYSPYFNLYLSSRGLDSAKVGIVLAMIPLVGIFAQPFWGMMNDHFQRHKLTMATGIVAPALGLQAIRFAHGVGLFVLIVCLMAMFQAAVIPLADSMTVQQTSSRHYGKVRLFGSLGYAITVSIAAQVYHARGMGFLGTFYAFAALLAVTAVVIYPSPERRPRLKYHSPVAGLGRVLSQRTFVLVLMFTLLCSISQGVNNNFFSLYYQELHRPLSFLGIIYGAGGLSELPFLFFAGWLIEKRGPIQVLAFAMSVYTFRWLVMAFAPPTWVLFALQLTHGMSFGLALAAGVSLASQVSDETNRATAQAVYSMVNTALSAIAGSLIGGFLLNFYGPKGLYRFAAGLCVIGVSGIYWLLTRTGKASTSRQS